MAPAGPGAERQMERHSARPDRPDGGPIRLLCMPRVLGSCSTRSASLLPSGAMARCSPRCTR